MNSIIIIEIEGCEGCKIAKKLTRNAIVQSNVTAELIFMNGITPERNKEFCNNHNIKDFPTTLFVKDSKILESYVGTKPISEIIDKIKIHFVDNPTVEMIEA